MPEISAPVAATPSGIAESANAFGWRGNPLADGIGLALSGGGFRAMLFHAGALLRLNELGLLSRIDRIASVSGGSITAGVLAAQWHRYGQPSPDGSFANFREIFLPTIRTFATAKLDVLDVAIGLLPFTTAADHVTRDFDRLLFDGAMLQDLPDAPEFVFCATNMSTGVLWRFTKAYAGDYLIGFLPQPRILLATAVAASAAFPPFLSPLTLDVAPGDFRDWPADAGARRIDPAPFRQDVMLCDGGVYDNHGVEPIVKRYVTNFISDGGAPFTRSTGLQTDWVNQLRRVLDIEDSQVRALRRRDLIARFKLGEANAAGGKIADAALAAGARFGAYWGIDTDPAPMAVPGALDLDRASIEALAAVPTRLSDLGAGIPERLINWGYAIADRCLRAHYKGPEPLAPTPAHWPFP